MMRVFCHGSVCAGVRLSDMTTLSMASSSRDISRWVGVALGSPATGGQKPLNASKVVRPSNGVSAARSRSAQQASNAASIGRTMTFFPSPS